MSMLRHRFSNERWGGAMNHLLTAGNDRGVTPHSIDQSNQFRSRKVS